MGEDTQGFEQEFAAFIGAKHTLAVTNATPPCTWPAWQLASVRGMR